MAAKGELNQRSEARFSYRIGVIAYTLLDWKVFSMLAKCIEFCLIDFLAGDCGATIGQQTNGEGASNAGP